MKFKSILFSVVAGITVLGLLSLGACTHQFYGGTLHHVPMLDHKNEVALTGTIGQAEENTFSSLNAAWAVSNRLGLYGQFFRANGGQGYSSGGMGAYGDMAIGIFDTLKNKFRYETMLGFGNAVVHNNYGQDKYTTNSFSKYYIQGNLGYKRKYFEACFALKAGYVHQYGFFPTDTLGMFETQKQDWLEISQNPNQICLEPGFLISGGSKNVKLQLGFGTSKLFPFGTQNTYKYQTAYVNVGIKFNFTALK